MTTLAEHMIVAGADNRPPMLEKSMYTSWVSHMFLYIKGKEHGRMMLNSVLNGPLVYPTIEVDGVTRLKAYEELSDKEKLQDDYDLCAMNIVLQGLPPDIYALVNHNQVALNKFGIRGETLHDYYMRFAQLMNDIHIIGMTMQQVQLYAYLSQYEGHANEVRLMRERVIVQQVQGRQSQGYASNSSKSNATASGGEGHMARQCTQPKRARNSAWFKEKLMLAEAHDSGQVLDEEQLAFLEDL
ncbi:hypothetical protein Tco_1415428, partial [Tanacetum coccineum]